LRDFLGTSPATNRKAAENRRRAMSSRYDYLLIPGGVGTSSATLWIGSTDVNASRSPTVVEHPAGQAWPVAGWEQWQAPGSPTILTYTRMEIAGLESGTTYPLALRVGGDVRAGGEVTTLPRSLPPVTEPSFNVLLGSCFCAAEDAGGNVGRTFAQLPGALAPHLKLLVGDQVYLDSPWSRFIVPHGESRLAAAFLHQYVSTWGQGADHQGFNLLLRSGANYFCGDDHEFWNNVPFPSSFVVDTWTEAGRRTWWRLATQLYRIFQTTETFTAIDVGGFPILIVDSRLNRTRDRSHFVSPEDMDRLRAWVDGLDGPGMLVLSQPILTTRAGFFGRYADWQLADFTQYAELCRILLSSRQSIIIGCGDVHFGRVAQATLPSGAELVEVVSSPMTLVDPFAKAKWTEAPKLFPADPLPGITSVPVVTRRDWIVTGDHFVTLHLHRDGGGVRCRLLPWFTTRHPTPATATAVDFVLKKEA
jgi:hypothetical protein